MIPYVDWLLIFVFENALKKNGFSLLSMWLNIIIEPVKQKKKLEFLLLNKFNIACFNFNKKS